MDDGCGKEEVVFIRGKGCGFDGFKSGGGFPKGYPKQMVLLNFGYSSISMI